MLSSTVIRRWTMKFRLLSKCFLCTYSPFLHLHFCIVAVLKKGNFEPFHFCTFEFEQRRKFPIFDSVTAWMFGKMSSSRSCRCRFPNGRTQSKQLLVWFFKQSASRCHTCSLNFFCCGSSFWITRKRGDGTKHQRPTTHALQGAFC